MPQRREFPEDLRGKKTSFWMSISLEKVTKPAISKALRLLWTTIRAILSKWRKIGRVVNIPRNGCPSKISPRARCKIIQIKTSKELQASHASAKVSVHDSTIIKTWGKNGTHCRLAPQKPLLSRKNINACLKFAKKHRDDPEFWNHVLWTD